MDIGITSFYLLCTTYAGLWFISQIITRHRKAPINQPIHAYQNQFLSHTQKYDPTRGMTQSGLSGTELCFPASRWPFKTHAGYHLTTRSAEVNQPGGLHELQINHRSHWPAACTSSAAGHQGKRTGQTAAWNKSKYLGGWLLIYCYMKFYSNPPTWASASCPSLFHSVTKARLTLVQASNLCLSSNETYLPSYCSLKQTS